MQKFYDYDIKNPFDVTDEKHVIPSDCKVRLNYTPQQGTVTIQEYTEVDDISLVESKCFFIDYQSESDYKQADQYIYFNPSDAESEVLVNYKGVSTLILAKHFNEIKDFMEQAQTDLESKANIETTYNKEEVNEIINESRFNVLARNKSYIIGDVAFVPGLPSWARLDCVAAGVTGEREPVWEPVSVDKELVDGTVTWVIHDVKNAVYG